MSDCIAVMELQSGFNCGKCFLLGEVSFQNEKVFFYNFTVRLCHNCLYDLLICVSLIIVTYHTVFCWRKGPVFLYGGQYIHKDVRDSHRKEKPEISFSLPPPPSHQFPNFSISVWWIMKFQPQVAYWKLVRWNICQFGLQLWPAKYT